MKSNSVHLGTPIASQKFFSDSHNSFSERFSNLEMIALGLVGFSRWIYSEAKFNDSQIVFLEREGEFFQKAFHEVSKWCGYSEGPRTVLLAASRRATFPPAFYTDPTLSLKRLFNQYVDCGTMELEHSLNINIGNEIPPDLHGNDLLKFLLENHDVVSTMKNQVESQFEGFKNYFNSLVDPSQNILLVDIGWSGSIQKNIEDALNLTCTGRYLGVHSRNTHPVSMDSFLSANPDKEWRILRTVRPVEYLFNSEKASLEKYDGAKNTTVRLVRKADGVRHEARFGEIQKVIYDLLPWACEVADSENLLDGDLAEIFGIGLVGFLENPSEETLQYFLGGTHDESFGLGKMLHLDLSAEEASLAKSAFDNSDNDQLLKLFWKIGWIPAFSHELSRNGISADTTKNIEIELRKLLEFEISDEFIVDSLLLGSTKSELISYIRDLKSSMASQAKLIDERDSYVRQLESVLSTLPGQALHLAVRTLRKAIRRK